MKHLLLGVFLAVCGPLHCYADCFGATFDTIGSGFAYTANFNTSLENCTPGNTRVTRLYIAGACSRHHDNNFDGFPPDCPPGDWNVLDTSSETCESIFELALPQDIRIPREDGSFDHGEVCNNGIKSVLFVQTDCSQLDASSIELHQQPLSGEYCWDGKTLSKGELSGIIIGAVVGACLLISAPVLVYACYKRRQTRRAMQAMQMDVEATGYQKDPFRPFRFGLSSQSVDFHSSGSTEDTYDIELDPEPEQMNASEAEARGPLSATLSSSSAHNNS